MVLYCNCSLFGFFWGSFIWQLKPQCIATLLSAAKVLQDFCSATKAQADELIAAAGDGSVEKVGGEEGGGDVGIISNGIPLWPLCEYIIIPPPPPPPPPPAKTLF